MKSILLLIVLWMLLPGYGFSQNWATFGGNSTRSGLSKITGPQDVTSPYWTVTGGNTTLGNAVYTFGNQFVTSRVIFSPYSGFVECRNLQTGGLIWISPFISTGSILYVIGYNDDGVYAHDYATDTIYSFNPVNGAIKWRSQIKSQTFGAYPGCVFACNGDLIVNGPVASGKFTMRLDKNTGDTLWTNNVLIAIGPAVGLAANESTVYRITGGITIPILLTAIDINTGATKYSSSPIPGDPDQENPITLGNDNQVYFWRDGGNLFSYTDTGSGFVQNWTYTPQTFTGAALYGNISIGNDNNLYVFDTGRLRRVNYITGMEIDSSVVPIAQGAVSIGGDSTVYVNDKNGFFYAFTYDLQNVKWQLIVSGNTYCNMALAREGVMVFTGSGTQIKAYQTVQNLPPVADFSVSQTTVLVGQPLNFSDQSSFSPTSWQWTFPGSNTGSSPSQNPGSVVYNLPGIYEVGLVVQNAFGADSIVKTCYIEVISPNNLNEPTLQSSPVLYPNPATNFINFTNGKDYAGVEFDVTDISGKIMYDGILSDSEININNWNDGVYFFRIYTYPVKVLKLIKVTD